MKDMTDADNWYISDDGVGYGPLPDALHRVLTRLRSVEKAQLTNHQRTSLEHAVSQLMIIKAWAVANCPESKTRVQHIPYSRRAPAISDG